MKVLSVVCAMSYLMKTQVSYDCIFHQAAGSQSMDQVIESFRGTWNLVAASKLLFEDLCDYDEVSAGIAEHAASLLCV